MDFLRTYSHSQVQYILNVNSDTAHSYTSYTELYRCKTVRTLEK